MGSRNNVSNYRDHLIFLSSKKCYKEIKNASERIIERKLFGDVP